KGDAIPSTIPIGKPLANVDIFIMSGGKLCGVGIPGELCIAGESLTSGYLNRPELSAEKFIENPFGPGQLYRSGDLARLMPDGQIEFLGRIDKQVKVHGYRIELGEIENIINSVDTVTDSVVILAKQSEHEVLHAYYVGSQEDENHISQHLNQYLPKYMIPNTLTAISEIPLTGNDKVDESKLPVPNVHKNKFVAPRNNIEREIAQIVSGVLDVSSMSIDDDFFEMGGTSLDAMVVVSKLKSNGIHITMQDVYQFKTVRYIANHTKTRQALPEVVLPDHLPQLQSLVERRYQLKPQHLAQSSLGHVLLTGATGFLGAYLIDEMQDNADQITCIVRGHDINRAKNNLENNINCYFDMAHVDKLMKHIDIVLADLSELDHLIIDSAIDTIIHAGARTDHFGDDETFFDVNVRSTQALIDLAKDKKAKLIYISTISVGTVFKAHQDDISFSEKDLYKGQLFTSPYTKSKFYSEIKVLEAVNEGLAAQIIRLGNLTSASTGPLNMKNLTTNRFSIVMHDLLKMPFIGESISKAKVEFSFIDVTARHIIKLARSNAIPIIYHVYAPRSITMKQVIDNAKGSEMTVVSDSEFEQKLHELGMHELIGLNSNGDNQISGVTDSNMTQTVMKELQG
ncbi:MAG: SDR family oxidoreductase, partial [Staphylococcus epidermidis]|nr:SDR family oxidoreductase [Staphylococcus epidermidis]